ncbi:threonine synthase-like 1 isoform X2 [Sarcophilus harrisii]|uniref:threonine synthase-like 1 isoform X2 n=1 Tax=Sarcophilus harrisii TaxID=9305 RepID=UPI001301BCC3|nr:threonine synthase-like 1 isoform X2 [Sarcophilus harrisii]XP_031795710.1 threonine synthase-like 1 isoform X2 [Sarcophilus harrisii]
MRKRSRLRERRTVEGGEGWERRAEGAEPLPGRALPPWGGAGSELVAEAERSLYWRAEAGSAASEASPGRPLFLSPFLPPSAQGDFSGDRKPLQRASLTPPSCEANQALEQPAEITLKAPGKGRGLCYLNCHSPKLNHFGHNWEETEKTYLPSSD